VARPLLLAIDADPESLSRIETHLQRRFGADYRVRGELSSEVALALLQEVVLPVELSFAIGHPSLFALHLLTPPADLELPFLAQSNELFLAAEDGGLAEAIRFALRFAHDSFGCFFGCRAGLLLAAELGAPSNPSADKEKNRAGKYEQKYAGCGYPRRVRHMEIYVGPAAKPQAAPIAPESRRVADLSLFFGGRLC